jgi:hypothetical protein
MAACWEGAGRRGLRRNFFSFSGLKVALGVFSCLALLSMSAIAPRGPHGHVRYRAWLHAHWLLARAGVAELVDALVLGTSIVRCGGSSPFARTNRNRRAEPMDGRI